MRSSVARAIELACILTAVAVGVDAYTWQTLSSVIRHLSVVPVLIAAIVRMEHPPPGRGVGQKAGPLAGVNVLIKTSAAAAPSPKSAAADVPLPLGKDGALLADHAYIIVFFNLQKGCAKAVPKIEGVARRMHSVAGSWAHTVLVSHEPVERLEQHMLKRAAGKYFVAHDAHGSAFEHYMKRFGAMVVPQAFVVDEAGIILWHGQTNRAGFSEACATLLRQHQANLKKQ